MQLKEQYRVVDILNTDQDTILTQQLTKSIARAKNNKPAVIIKYRRNPCTHLINHGLGCDQVIPHFVVYFNYPCPNGVLVDHHLI